MSHLLSLAGQRPVPGVVRAPRCRDAATVRARARARAGRWPHGGRAPPRAWDVVQSHERTLRQDVYRAGEGCHRAYLDTPAGEPRRGLVSPAVLALERRVFTRTPAHRGHLAGGRGGDRAALRVLRPGSRVIYNGVDLERFHPDNRGASPRAARAEAGVPDGRVGGSSSWAAASSAKASPPRSKRWPPRAIPAPAARHRQGRHRRLTQPRRAARPGRSRRRGSGPRPDVERWYAAADVRRAADPLRAVRQRAPGGARLRACPS